MKLDDAAVLAEFERLGPLMKDGGYMMMPDNLIRPGVSLADYRAYHPGCHSHHYLSAGTAGVLAAARWGRTELISDRSWKCRQETGIRRDAVYGPETVVGSRI